MSFPSSRVALARNAFVGPSAVPALPTGRGDLFSKRAVDIVGSLLLMTAALPIYLACAVLIKLTSPGPIFFRQRRLGMGGREFWCYKFRTMVTDAEEQLASRPGLRSDFEANYKLQDDPRVTRVGGFLRRSSLDEFPQLWNVVRGDMSLIGPRPIVSPELSKYGTHAHQLLSVKPGLGGLWQVNGRSNTTYEERVALDLAYVHNRSLELDLRLLACTAWVVLRGRGSC